MSDYPIYLDYNATTPIDPEVAEAMLPYLYDHFGNPSSSHHYGQVARDAVDHARGQVAGLLGCTPDEIVFTASGTESNNTVLKGVAQAYAEKGRHIITTAVEHPAVLEPCEALEQQGYEITILPVDSTGQVDPNDVKAALRPNTILVSVMAANNEVGTIQPIQAISQMAHANDTLVHTDAAQAVGKIPVDVRQMGVDFLSVAGHKLYAPKGVGALYIREGLFLPKFMHGASHENNRRAGTENVLEIVGLGQAAEIARRDMRANTAHMMAMRDRLYNGLAARLDRIQANGHPVERLPNTLSVSFRDVEANALLDLIGAQVAASAGAACHSDTVNVSTVLAAMQVPIRFAMGTLRLTVGKMTTGQEIDEAIKVLVEAVRQLRR